MRPSRLPGGVVGLLRRMQSAVVIDHAGLADTGDPEDGTADRFPAHSTPLVTAAQEANRLAKPRVKHDELMGIRDTIFGRNPPPVTPLADIFGIELFGHWPAYSELSGVGNRRI